MATLTMLLAIVPGGLGLREVLVAVMSLAAGYDFSAGLFAGTVDRVALLAPSLVLGAMGLAYVSHRFRRAYPGQAEG
ncbi:MAG: hypothetical protein GWO16_10480 [Gammaproteobacteria bacterium]|nr:hypothetical protein [Gammaproteobacteria bacterium]NIR98338.1 hypothetical protein [Gammaproteobacteria bacterium]NIT64085.1 hypothetical protein [Gammaproteobacteria bacterium]NIV21016.1 hypothetical protein [Gammaproteobacteria bacterium]NIX10413.1 hypothetical protein [Gammaproteobacteria bacterium]